MPENSQTEPVRKCSRCKGLGYYYAVLVDRAGRNNHSCGTEHVVSCDMAGCHNGIMNLKENYASF